MDEIDADIQGVVNGLTEITTLKLTYLFDRPERLS